MKDMLDRLVHLQETDEKIVAFQKEEEEIPKHIHEREKSVEILEEEHNQIRATLDDLEKQIAEINVEMEEVKDHQRRCQARALAVNPTTVVKAYNELQHEGVIAMRHGKGAFVAESAARPSARERRRALRRLARQLAVEASQMGASTDEVLRVVQEELEKLSHE